MELPQFLARPVSFCWFDERLVLCGPGIPLGVCSRFRAGENTSGCLGECKRPISKMVEFGCTQRGQCPESAARRFPAAQSVRWLANSRFTALFFFGNWQPCLRCHLLLWHCMLRQVD